MPWVLVLLLLPLVLFVVFLRRVIPLARRLRDPEQLGRLLSEDVRAALRRAGLDPDSVSIQEIQKSEQLTRLVAADLRRVLLSVVLGLPQREPTGSPRHMPDALPADEGDSGAQRWSIGTPRQAGPLELPRPIEPSPVRGRRAVAVLAILGLLAIAIFFVNFQL